MAASDHAGTPGPGRLEQNGHGAPSAQPAGSRSHYRAQPLRSGVLRRRWEQLVGPGAGYRQRVLPDGCADVLVDSCGAAVLVGPTLRPAVVRLGAGTTYRCLRLRPGTIPAALGAPAHLLVDRVLPLRDVAPGPVSERMIDAARGDDGALRTLERRWRDVPLDPRVRGALRWLAEHGDRDVQDLAAAAGRSPRRLRRLLVTHTGLGPEPLQRVFRLHRFLRLAEAPGGASGLAVAASLAGYADRAHLGHDVRVLAGLPPAALLRERAATPDGSAVVASSA